MTKSLSGSVIWDEVDSGPAVCLANVAPSGQPYQSCGKKLKEVQEEDGSYMVCTKHGEMH